MIKFYLICVTLSCILHKTIGQRFVWQNCPANITAIQNFEVTRYLGLWYELQRYEHIFELDGECVQAKYSLNDDESVNVLNSMTKPPSQKRKSASGRAVLSYPGATPVEAKLNVTFGPIPPILSNYWVVDTDYDNYSLVYACLNLGFLKSVEFAWVLSRTAVINEEVEDHVTEAIDKYFVRSELRVTKQDAELCQY